MKHSILFFALSLCALCSFADNYDEYKDFESYKRAYKEWYGVSLSIPSSLTDYCDRGISCRIDFDFGKQDESKTQTLFDGLASVWLADGCEVFMPDIIIMGKPRVDETFPKERKVVNSPNTVFLGCLRNNCGIPHTDWFQYSDWDRRKIDKACKKITKKYVCEYTDGAIVGRTGADKLYIVEFPNFKSVTCHSEDLDSRIKRDFNRCYGVEFRCGGREDVLKMLFFVNTKAGKTIDDYVDMMSRYISFDKDFVLE